MADKNPIFDALGASSDDDDIQSLVAYSLYKRHKREWANSIRAKHDRDPTYEEDVQFFQAVATPSSLDRFRQSAGDMLVAFASQVVDEQRPSIVEEAVSSRVESASTKIEASSKFWRQVGASVIASGVTISILVTLTIAAEIFGIDVVDESAIVERVLSNEAEIGTTDQ